MQEAWRDLFRQDCLLAETFVLDLELESPLNILVDTENLIKYQVMFRLLFYVKFVENQLSTTWQHNQKLKGIKVVQFFCQSLSKSTNFVKGLLDYLTGLLEEYSREFFRAYDESGTFDQVVTAHQTFLDTVLEDMFACHPEILSLLYMILNHTLKFNTFITREIEEIQQAQLNIANKLEFQSVTPQRRIADTRA